MMNDEVRIPAGLTVSDIVAALKYYDFMVKGVEEGIYKPERLTYYLAATAKWQAALDAATDRMPETDSYERANPRNW